MRPVHIARFVIAGSVLWMLPASVFGEGEFPAAALGSLASEDYKDRVQAQRDLIAWGQEKPEQAEERLLKEFDAATDPEVRLRLREALKEVVVSEYQKKEGQGYVGIQMDERNVVLPGENDPRGGVLVTWVHPETPAMKAGLQVNDVIIGLNDLRWTVRVGAREAFAMEIRRHKPGDKVNLEVFRGAEVKKMEMTLAARPMGLERAAPLLGAPANDLVEELKLAEKKAKDEYFERWMAGKRAAAKKP